MNKNPNTPTETRRAANCLFCDAETPFGITIRYNRTGLIGACCPACETNVFAEPSSLWTREESPETAPEPTPEPEVESHGPYALGDVLVSSWGYEQTNIDFYQVVGFTKSGKSVRLIAIESEQVEVTGFMTEKVRPCPGCPVEGAKSFTKRIPADGTDYISLSSYSFARKVDRDTYTATHYA